MPHSRSLRLLSAAALMVIAGPALAAENGDGGRTVMPDLPRAQSLPGAYLAAKSAQIDGDLDAAASFYNQALAIDPGSGNLQRDAMFAFLASGDFDRAADLADELVGTADAGKVAQITLGVGALAKGDYEAALESLSLEDPSDLDALLAGELRAWAHLGAGNPDRALSQVDRMNGAAWYSVFTNYQKGLLATVAGRTEVARSALQEVVGNPSEARTSPDAFLSAAAALARLEAGTGDREAALSAVDQGLAVASSFDPLTNLRDRIERGETIEPAVTDVREGAAESLYILGQAVNRGDGRQVAQMYFQLARTLAPRNPAVLTALAGVAEQTGHLERAIAIYRDIPANSAYHRTAELQIGLDLWRAERKDEAKAHLEAATEEYPEDIQAYTAYADVLSAAKDYERTAAVLDDAIALAREQDAETWRLYYQRGIAYERTDRWPKAEADFKQALDMSPREPDVLNYLGYSWVDQDRNLEEGLEMIKTAVELQPNDGYIVDSLGWAYYRLGRYDEAVTELERAVLITPMDPTINEHLGDAYWQVGREREARFQWERALESEPAPDEETLRDIEAKLENGLETDQTVGTDRSEDRRATAGSDAGSGAQAGPRTD